MAKQGKRAALAVIAAAMAMGFGGVAMAAEATPTAKATPTPTPTAASTPTATSSEPDSTTAQYGDWVLRCARLPSGGRACEAQQNIEVKGQVVAQIAVGRLDPKAPLLATAVLPPNVSFPSIVLASIDEKDDHALELSWQQCLPGGCFARAELKDDMLKRWRGQSGTGVVRYLNAAKQPLTLTFSFRGFANAIDSPAKNAAAQ